MLTNEKEKKKKILLEHLFIRSGRSLDSKMCHLFCKTGSDCNWYSLACVVIRGNNPFTAFWLINPVQVTAKIIYTTHILVKLLM